MAIAANSAVGLGRGNDYANGRGIGARTGPFRPFRSFGENERTLFFGREPELASLVELFAADRPTVLLTGESAIGRTSFLRAAVMPYFASRGMSCLYLHAGRLLTDVPQPGTNGGLLVLDDLGEALADPAQVDILIELLRRVAQHRTVKVLFAMDDGSLHRLEPFEKRVGPLAPPGTRLRLERFDTTRTADVIERTVLAGGGYFESGLSQEMAQDLCADGPISPSELQVVAGATVALQLTTIKAFRSAGGAEALVWRYLEVAAKDSGGLAAERILGELAASDGPRSVERLAFSAGVMADAAQKMLSGLDGAGLARPSDAGYEISNEWLRRAAMAATGPARGAQVAARLELRKAVVSGSMLGPGAVGRIRRFAGGLKPEEATVVARSSRLTTLGILALLSVGGALIATSYLGASRTHYFDTAGPGPGGPVVIRLGARSGFASRLPHVPAFRSIVTDTGFALASLRGPLPEGGLSGDWTEELAPALRPLPRAILALLSSGDGRRLAEVFEDPASRGAVLDALSTAGTGAAAEIDLVKRGLEDEAESVRRHAVMAAVALEGRRPGAVGGLLARAWKDPSGAVRALAMTEVGRLPDGQAVPLFVDALSEDPVTRKGALDAIGARIDRTPAAAAALGRALIGPAAREAGVLVQRVLLQGGVGADALATTLSAVALDANSPEDARLEALRLLRQSPKPPDGLEAVTGSQRLQAAALPLLARKQPDVAAAKIAEAMKGSAALRAGAAAAIGVMPRTADTPKLLKILSYDDNVEVRAEASRAQIALGREALGFLIKDSKQGGAEVERAAVETMGTFANRLGFPSAVSALETAAKGPRPATRKAAIEALGRLASEKPGQIAASLGRLSREKSPQVRADAASGLGDVLERGAKEAVVALRAQGKDPDPQTRRKAAEALGRAKGPLQPLAAKALASLTDDGEANVRAAVADALASLGAGAAPEGAAVTNLLGDKDGGVRAAAHRAAQSLGITASPGGKGYDKVLLTSFSQASIADRIDIAITAGRTGSTATVRAALADADAGVRRAAAENAQGAPLLPALVGALGDPDAAVRVAAVRGLVGAKAVTQLGTAARSTEIEVRLAALEAIGEVGGPEAQRVLQEALGEAEERIRIAAARGLGLMGPDAASVLEKAIHDPVRGVREAAALGLGGAWKTRPIDELAARLATDDDADLRYAAALALACRGVDKEGEQIATKLDALVRSGTPATRLAARMTRAYLGHPTEMAEFLRILRDGM